MNFDDWSKSKGYRPADKFTMGDMYLAFSAGEAHGCYVNCLEAELKMVHDEVKTMANSSVVWRGFNFNPATKLLNSMKFTKLIMKRA